MDENVRRLHNIETDTQAFYLSYKINTHNTDGVICLAC